jgi:hypothetical protein
MKHGTHTLPKFIRLKRILQQPMCTVRGMLDAMWEYAYQAHPNGDLGADPADDIADVVEWPADARKLVAALIETHWLDVTPSGHLLIHDWPEHCEDAVHMRLARAHQFFANGKYPKLCRISGKERAELDTWYASDEAKRVCTETLSVCTNPPSVHTPCTQNALPCTPPPLLSASSPPPPPPPEEEDTTIPTLPAAKPKRRKQATPPKDRPRNAYADAFKAAWDQTNPDAGGYAWKTADFVRLAEWTPSHPTVTPERFAEVARLAWGKGDYCPRGAFTIKGLCADWETIVAKVASNGNAKPSTARSNAMPPDGIDRDEGSTRFNSDNTQDVWHNGQWIPKPAEEHADTYDGEPLPDFLRT